MYSAKIPGSRYILALENVAGQWMLRILLDNNTEAEIVMVHMNKRSVLTNMGSLFNEMNIQVPPIQNDLIHKEIISQIVHLFQEQDPSKEDSEIIPPTSNINEQQIKDILASIEKLEKSLELVNDRLERLEQMSSN